LSLSRYNENKEKGGQVRLSREENESSREYVARGLQLDRAHFPRAVSPMQASLINVIGNEMRKISEESYIYSE